MDNILNELFEKEKTLSIYNERIWGIPLWSCIKRKYRSKYLFIHAKVPPMSNHPKFYLWPLVRSFIVSFWHILKLFICSEKKPNLFLGFMRLEQMNGLYMDKFIEPIILLSELKDKYVYFERGRSGIHISPRSIKNIVWTEFIDNFCTLMSCGLFPFFVLFNWKTYGNLIDKINYLFPISLKERFYIYYITTRFLLKALFLCLVLKRLGVKRLFIPAAVIHYQYIAACKLLKIPCYEIQHGITAGQTYTYSGEYVPEAYPDYFLTFGKSSLKDSLFGLPLGRMINIGCAFKSFLKERNVVKLKNTYLLLSEPEITQKMVHTIVELAKMYPEYTFHLRLHPLEVLNQCQGTMLSEFANIALVDNIINSTIVCMDYEGVIAENTTVLYEAVSVGVKAARLQYNGLQTIHFEDEPRDLFFYMKRAEDFSSFANEFDISDANVDLFYSTFDVKTFNTLLVR